MDYIFLSGTALFRGASPKEIEAMLGCLEAEKRDYHRGDIIYCAGDVVGTMGLVLSGSASIENGDVWGNRSILDKVGPGMVFAETYACIPGEPMMVSVVAAEDTEILFLNISRVLYTCPNACGFHSKLIQNLLSISARKNLKLSRRIFHTSSKSIRGRLLSYLSFQAVQNESNDFEISFNRQQLADYLSVDRSAMSNELSKMQKDGLLKVDRNHFTLLGTEANDIF